MSKATSTCLGCGKTICGHTYCAAAGCRAAEMRENMNKSKHTPLPWKIDPMSDATIAIMASRDSHVCLLEPRDDGEGLRESDAALIIRAVNSHVALVAALSAMADAWPAQKPESPHFNLYNQARAALALAEGTT